MPRAEIDRKINPNAKLWKIIIHTASPRIGLESVRASNTDDCEDDDDDMRKEIRTSGYGGMRAFLLYSRSAAMVHPPCSNSYAPMPVLPVSSTYSTHHTPAPPAAALKPLGETLKEREARYRAARDRIFGEVEEIGAGAAKKAKARGVVRNPKGPDTNTDGTTPSRGFGARNPPAPPRRTPSHDLKS
ncbi:hypothetical protein K438DRAFT_1932533 [Mycena galopus ATCC 62051]|nr:hypothetical protein K438DRAFT_1932533 [Mycena galopus ATCC 62051]